MSTGAGGNPSGCPGDAPAATGLQQCNIDTTAICNYPGETCACRAAGAFNTWSCILCPAFEPMNGSSCNPATGNNNGGVNCAYGNNFCACRNDGWYCRCNGCP